mmetsp:Transcript_24750/g.57143  ORF Transcript_24750/g.57143 Transcript_24750/m.57143 type:complete len:224 (-) Transcript_24750:246-917(-)
MKNSLIRSGNCCSASAQAAMPAASEHVKPGKRSSQGPRSPSSNSAKSASLTTSLDQPCFTSNVCCSSLMTKTRGSVMITAIFGGSGQPASEEHSDAVLDLKELQPEGNCVRGSPEFRHGNSQGTQCVVSSLGLLILSNASTYCQPRRDAAASIQRGKSLATGTISGWFCPTAPSTKPAICRTKLGVVPPTMKTSSGLHVHSCCIRSTALASKNAGYPQFSILV